MLYLVSPSPSDLHSDSGVMQSAAAAQRAGTRVGHWRRIFESKREVSRRGVAVGRRREAEESRCCKSAPRTSLRELAGLVPLH